MLADKDYGEHSGRAPDSGLTTHSTGARVSVSFIENLAVMALNARPVNSSVRRYVRARVLSDIE